MKIDVVLRSKNGEVVKYDYKLFLEDINTNKDFKRDYKVEMINLELLNGDYGIYADENIEDAEEILNLINRKIIDDVDEKKLSYCLDAYFGELEFVLNNIEDIDVIEVCTDVELGEYLVYELDIFPGIEDNVKWYLDYEKIGRDYGLDYMKVKGAYVRSI